MLYGVQVHMKAQSGGWKRLVAPTGVVVHWSYTLELYAGVVYWSYCTLELYIRDVRWSCTLELYTGVVAY